MAPRDRLEAPGFALYTSLASRGRTPGPEDLDESQASGGKYVVNPSEQHRGVATDADAPVEQDHARPPTLARNSIEDRPRKHRRATARREFGREW